MYGNEIQFKVLYLAVGQDHTKFVVPSLYRYDEFGVVLTHGYLTP